MDFLLHRKRARRRSRPPHRSAPGCIAAALLLLTLLAAPASAKDPEPPPQPVQQPAPQPAHQTAPEPVAGPGRPYRPPRPQRPNPWVEPWVSVGYRLETGGAFNLRNHHGAQLSAFHVTEHNGSMGRLALLVMYAAAAAATNSDTEYLGTSYSHHYGYTVRTDYYRQLSAQEIAARDAAQQQVMDSIATAASDSFHVLLYTDQFDTTFHGWFAHFVAVQTPRSERGLQFDFGFAFGLARSAMDVRSGTNAAEANGDGRYTWSFAGVPIRATLPVNRFLTFQLQYDLNFFSIEYLDRDLNLARRTADPNSRRYGQLRTSPLRLSATLNPINRLYLHTGASLGGWSLDMAGWQAEAGIRF